MTWCGYIDILGAREAAKRSEANLIRSLDRFHSALGTCFDVFKDAQCSAFSDGAFFKTESFNNLYPYISRVRNQLFQHGVFYRASYIPGEIKFFDRETDEDGAYTNPSPPAFRSFTFGGRAPSAYQKETELKAVGCTIDSAWQNETHAEKVAPCFGVKIDGRRLTTFPFYDFIFDKYEIGCDPEDGQQSYIGQARILDAIFMAAHSASAQSEKVGSYYVSLFVLAINSTDMSRISVDGKDVIAGPYIYERFFGPRSAARAIKDISGLHYVLLRAWDKMYVDMAESMPSSLEDHVVSSLMRRPKCFKELADIPDYVISGKAKDRLIEVRAKLERVLT